MTLCFVGGECCATQAGLGTEFGGEDCVKIGCRGWVWVFGDNRLKAVWLFLRNIDDNYRLFACISVYSQEDFFKIYSSMIKHQPKTMK